MRTRTRALAVSAMVAATAQLAAAQGPARGPAAPARAAAQVQPPGTLPPTLPTQPAPEGAPPPATPEQQPPSAAQPLPPVGAPAAPGCAPCNGPAAAPAAPAGVATNIFCDDHRGPKEATWVRLEHSLNWFKDLPVPVPLAVASVGPGGPVVLGSDEIDTGMHHGGRFELGTWVNDRHTFGYQLGGMLIEQRSRYQTVAAPALSRPFFNILAGGQDALVVAAPGVATGEVATGYNTRLSGLEANAWWNVAESDCHSVNLFAGFRYLDLDEALAIYSTTRPVGAPLVIAGTNGQPRITVPVGQPLELTDRFRTRNQFYGGQVGMRYERRRGIFFAHFTPRVGFGPNHQSVHTDGKTRVPGQDPLPGGLLAVGETSGAAGRTGNIGRDVTNRFTLMTELSSTVGVQVTSSMRLGVGYNFLYLNNVARPGNQIDVTVNPRLVPASSAFGALSGPRAPNQTFDREQFWVHGVTFSVEFMY